MSFPLKIKTVCEMIEKGYLHEAFSEIMNKRMDWTTKWPRWFRARYLIDQLGQNNVKTLYWATRDSDWQVYGGRPSFDRRSLSKRRLKVLEDAYGLLMK